MSTPFHTLACVILAAVLSSCGSSLAVIADWDHHVDFSGFRTFTWLEPAGDAPGDRLPEHLDIRLRRVVEEVLIDKGLEPAPAFPQADLALTYFVSTQRELRVDLVTHSYYGGYTYGYWGGYPGYGTTTARVREYATGSVVIDIVDRKTRQLVWTCAVEGEIKSANPPGERVEAVVRKMLRDFPPSP
jgi:hypothetical protein